MSLKCIQISNKVLMNISYREYRIFIACFVIVTVVLHNQLGHFPVTWPFLLLQCSLLRVTPLRTAKTVTVSGVSLYPTHFIWGQKNVSLYTGCPKVRVTSNHPLNFWLGWWILKCFGMVNTKSLRFCLVYHTWPLQYKLP